MFVCPTCNKKYATEEEIKKHSLACWRKANPHYKSKPTPQGETIVTKEVSDDILSFFSSFKKEDGQYDGKN